MIACPLRRLDLKLDIFPCNDVSKKKGATGAAAYGSLQSML